MLTFEEFSAKKKIDLSQFQQAEPALYSEFKSEYEQMGEKSFDHSKKFLFNKIRRAYHLKEEPKPPKTEIEITEIASQAEPLSSPTIEQTPAYTPRFKPRISTQPKQETSPEKDPLTVPENSTFEGSSTESINNDSLVIKNDPITHDKEAVDIKPAYKPKFKMQNIPKVSEEKPVETQSQAEPPVSDEEKPEIKPAAYKPRFNMKNIKPKEEG